MSNFKVKCLCESIHGVGHVLSGDSELKSLVFILNEKCNLKQHLINKSCILFFTSPLFHFCFYFTRQQHGRRVKMVRVKQGGKSIFSERLCCGFRPAFCPERNQRN